jgi:DNA invertase Pin-like site-specific DNA recombinase
VSEVLESSPTLDAIRAARGAGKRRVRRVASPDCVVAYVRVSTDEQAASGLGLDAQRAAITDECERRGWDLCAVYADEGVSGSAPPDLRPALARAIRVLDAHEAGTLMVAKLDRLGRSLTDLLVLTSAAKRAGWSVVDVGGSFDMSTPQGEAMAQMMGAFAQLERSLIAERTKSALAVRRMQGVQLGRPSQVSAEARARLSELRREGKSWRLVAAAMNTEGWPSGSGRPAWQPATARRLCEVRSIEN